MVASSFAKTKPQRRSKFLKTKPRAFSLRPGNSPLSLNNISWGRDTRFRISNFGSACMQNIQVLSYLAHGAYGIAYKARYNEQRCVLKIVPLNYIKAPVTQKTLKSDFEREVQILRIASDAGVGPKMYHHGICVIDLLDTQENKKVKVEVGFVVLEYFDVSLKRIVTDALDAIVKIPRVEDFKTFLYQMTKFLMHIDKQIHADLQRCVTELNLHPRDLHRDNILYQFQNNRARVVDWGMATISRKSRTRPQQPGDQPDSSVVLAHPFYYTCRFLKDVESETYSIFGGQVVSNKLSIIRNLQSFIQQQKGQQKG